MKDYRDNLKETIPNRASPFLKDRALAAAAEGITISDAILPDQPILYVNEGFERLTGYSASEIVGTNCRFLQGENTDPRTIEEISKAISEDRSCSVEILNHRKDGTPFWNRLSITPVKNEAGLKTHHIEIQTDITQRKKVEQALEESNRRLEEANRSMREDLEAAARIQQTMLPGNLPEIPGYDFSWYFKPCDELAGDTLGILPLDKNHVSVYSVDVSGHGVPSALLSATLSHWFSPKPDQETVLESGREKDEKQPVPPDRLAARLNRLFPMDLEHPQYFTLYYGLLQADSGRFTFVSAGHPPAVLVKSSGEIRTLESGAPPVGLLAASQFKQDDIILDPGDRIFIYTDGLTEAFNPEEEELGFSRLVEAMRDSRELPLRESINVLVSLVEGWTGGNKPDDDISIVAFEKLSE